MSLFQSVLQKITKSLESNEYDRKISAEVISSYIKSQISIDQIKIREKKLFISAHPTIKLIIKVKEKELIQALQSKNIPILTIN